MSDKIFKNAAFMALGTLISRVLGLARDILFAALFDKTITDAWGVAFRLPNLFRRLLGEGSLAVAFIPVFIEAKQSDSGDIEAKNLVNAFYSCLLVFLASFTVLGILFAEPMIKVLVGHHFHEVPGKFELTVRMAQIMFVFIFLMSTYAFFMGILNALGQFGLPAAAPAFFNISMIVSMLLPGHWESVDGDFLAWGVVAGGLAQVAILIPSLQKKGFLPKLQWKLWNSKVKQVLLAMLPGMLGTGLLQLTTIINTYFASSLGEGSNTYIFLADRILELPLSLVAVSLGAALLPALSSAWSLGDHHKMKETAQFYLQLNLFVAVPAAMGLFLYSEPIVQLLFQRGEFSWADVMKTSDVVQVYAITLVASSCVRVFVPNFYAMKNTWYPAVVSSVCLLIHFLIAPLMMQNWGIAGLTGSTALSAVINFALLVGGFHFWVGGFGYLKFIQNISKFLVPNLMIVASFVFFNVLLRWLPDQKILHDLALILSIFLAGILFILSSRKMKIAEYDLTVGPRLNRLFKKIGL